MPPRRHRRRDDERYGELNAALDSGLRERSSHHSDLRTPRTSIVPGSQRRFLDSANLIELTMRKTKPPPALRPDSIGSTPSITFDQLGGVAVLAVRRPARRTRRQESCLSGMVLVVGRADGECHEGTLMRWRLAKTTSGVRSLEQNHGVRCLGCWGAAGSRQQMVTHSASGLWCPVISTDHRQSHRPPWTGARAVDPICASAERRQGVRADRCVEYISAAVIGSSAPSSRRTRRECLALGKPARRCR